MVAETDVATACKRFCELEVPNGDAAVGRITLYLNRMAPAKYADLSEEEMLVERDWIANEPDPVESDEEAI